MTHSWRSSEGCPRAAGASGGDQLCSQRAGLGDGRSRGWGGADHGAGETRRSASPSSAPRPTTALPSLRCVNTLISVQVQPYKRKLNAKPVSLTHLLRSPSDPRCIPVTFGDEIRARFKAVPLG